MDREEVTLRAKIQAMKNVMQVNTRPAHHHTKSYTQRVPATSFAKPYAPYYNRQPAVNKTWTRPGASPVQAPAATTQSANRVWVNSDAVRASPAVSAPSVPPARMSFATRVRNRMQLQVLRLEDGEYAKANGGFSLVRSDALQARAAEAAKRTPHTAFASRRLALSSAASTRAQLVVSRARASTRAKAKTRVRTEYCRFFNKFGYCNNKNACKFLHDSRRVALCRDFAKGDCKNEKCLLSHDKNKMPVCTLFLRGACTREDCRFRHVKVSGLAQVCEAFLKGYCPQGAACTMKHELPTAAKRKRQSPVSSTAVGQAEPPSKLPRRQEDSEAGTLSPPVSVGLAGGMSPNAGDASRDETSDGKPASPAAGVLSIRPIIRFAPRNSGLMPALLSLRKRPTVPPQ